MPDLNPQMLSAVVKSTSTISASRSSSVVAAFVLGGGYYAVLGDQLAEVSEAAAAATDGWRLGDRRRVRRLSLVLSAVVAGLASRGDIDTWTAGLVLGVVLWIGFPVVLWTGAVVHEGTPVKLAAIHAGDWLVKLLVVGLIVSTLQ